MTRDEIDALITAERERQRELWGGWHDWGRGDCSSDQVDAIVKVAVLTEECGEVAMAVLERAEEPDVLQDELVQVAAVAVAWLESFPGKMLEGQLGLLDSAPAQVQDGA